MVGLESSVLVLQDTAEQVALDSRHTPQRPCMHFGFWSGQNALHFNHAYSCRKVAGQDAFNSCHEPRGPSSGPSAGSCLQPSASDRRNCDSATLIHSEASEQRMPMPLADGKDKGDARSTGSRRGRRSR